MSRPPLPESLARLPSLASSLVAAPDLASLLSAVAAISPLLAASAEELERLPHVELDRVRAPLSEALVHLNHALIYAESRLQHERTTVLDQLRELAIQQEWVERSRQIT